MAAEAELARLPRTPWEIGERRAETAVPAVLRKAKNGNTSIAGHGARGTGEKDYATGIESGKLVHR